MPSQFEHMNDWLASAFYGGTNLGNEGQVRAAAVSSHSRGQSLELVLPPLATIFLRPDGE